MSRLVPLASREEKVSRACLVHQAPRERREPGAMTVSESLRMPRFSVQKARRERRGRQEPRDPWDPRAPQARRARKERGETEASRALRESQAEMAGRERSVSWGPKDRRETLALSGLRGWRESLGRLADLGPPG